MKQPLDSSNLKRNPLPPSASAAALWGQLRCSQATRSGRSDSPAFLYPLYFLQITPTFTLLQGSPAHVSGSPEPELSRPGVGSFANPSEQISLPPSSLSGATRGGRKQSDKAWVQHQTLLLLPMWPWGNCLTSLGLDIPASIIL